MRYLMLLAVVAAAAVVLALLDGCAYSAGSGSASVSITRELGVDSAIAATVAASGVKP